MEQMKKPSWLSGGSPAFCNLNQVSGFSLPHQENAVMLLISLMLAAAPTSAVKPQMIQRRHASRPRAASSIARSKRLIELEATVRSLPLAAADEQGHGPGPKGM
jgi:hypothetical protein